MILEPLIGDVPIVGAVTMFFIQRPVGSILSTFSFICPFMEFIEPYPVPIIYQSLVPCVFHVIDFLLALIDLLNAAHSSVVSLPRDWTLTGLD